MLGPVLLLGLLGAAVGERHATFIDALREEAGHVGAMVPQGVVCDPLPAPNACLLRSLHADGEALHAVHDPSKLDEVRRSLRRGRARRVKAALTCAHS